MAETKMGGVSSFGEEGAQATGVIVGSGEQTHNKVSMISSSVSI